jgi:hypothetical protein
MAVSCISLSAPLFDWRLARSRSQELSGRASLLRAKAREGARTAGGKRRGGKGCLRLYLCLCLFGGGDDDALRCAWEQLVSLTMSMSSQQTRPDRQNATSG